MKKNIIFLTVLTLFFYAQVFAQIEVGADAIPFTLPDTAGNEISLEDHAGKITMLNFFTTWCGPCQVEAPLLQDSIWTEYRDQNFILLAVNFQEGVRQISDFTGQYGVTYPVVLDTAGSVFNQYELRFFPTSVIINSDGMVAYVEEGFDIPEFQHVIDSLLNVSSIEDNLHRHGLIPNSIELIKNYPNPFNNQTRIVFRLSRQNPVSLQIYDVNGKIVREQERYYESGTHNMDISMNGVASGLYFYTLKTGSAAVSGKMILQK